MFNSSVKNHRTIIAAWLALFIVVASKPLSAQRNKAQLQLEKQRNIEKIKETEKIISETAEQKKVSLGELSAVNQRISQQEGLISSITNEISLLDSDIEENNGIINALQIDLSKLKEEYASMLFSAQKVSGKADKLMFLFSAKSFDQFLMRLKYMEQYAAVRKEQAKAIENVKTVLGFQVNRTEKIKKTKSQLLNEEENERSQLSTLKVKQKSVVKSLEKEERRLRRDLDETKKDVAKLDRLISDIIKEELDRLAREARERMAKTKANKNEPLAKDEDVVLSASFEDNKMKFPWPVSGFISQKFGRQDHPVLKGIILQNDGINIQTKQEERVKVIFNGDVRAVAFIPRIGNSVIVSHGDYFTVYSGLKEVLVKKGQKVKTSQEIGQVFVNTEGVSELRFQIRKNIEALDPQTWLKE